jgi:hypothetical protein
MLAANGRARREPGDRSVANRMFLNAISETESGEAVLIKMTPNDRTAKPDQSDQYVGCLSAFERYQSNPNAAEVYTSMTIGIYGEIICRPALCRVGKAYTRDRQRSSRRIFF